ncbi:MAG TPA: hypothetical protein VGE98_12585, partial [Thermoanaerobaculia bacterium]
APAIALVEKRRHQNGRWPKGVVHPDQITRVPIAIEPEVGRASRWITLRALRVLDWYGSS